MSIVAAPVDVRVVAVAPVTEPGLSVDTGLRLTAIALLLRPMGPWFARPILLALAALALCSPGVLRNWRAWAVIATMVCVRIAGDWPLADNHIYLLAYWALAIAMALRTRHTSDVLARSSRGLLTLVFAFAVLWKVVLSPDYADGRFFRVTLLTDPRFGAATRLISGLSAEQLEANREALRRLPEGAELLDPPSVHEPPAFRWLATASTWGVVLLETLVALVLILPVRGRVTVLRHVMLIGFCGTTYLFAPVAGFGWLLLAMGLVQLADHQVALRRTYVASFVLVIFYDDVPWADIWLTWLAR
jgi:hypothetical protein